MGVPPGFPRTICAWRLDLWGGVYPSPSSISRANGSRLTVCMGVPAVSGAGWMDGCVVGYLGE